MSELYEKLADIEHQRWSDWMKYQFSLCTVREDGTIVIPNVSANHWLRQMSIDYSDLSEEEKDSDREQVDRYWHFIEEKNDRIKALEGVKTQAKIIFDAVDIRNPRGEGQCPHGNSTGFPVHGWWCDECWFALEEALKKLEEV